jgi:hypothetical protein
MGVSVLGMTIEDVKAIPQSNVPHHDLFHAAQEGPYDENHLCMGELRAAWRVFACKKSSYAMEGTVHSELVIKGERAMQGSLYLIGALIEQYEEKQRILGGQAQLKEALDIQNRSKQDLEKELRVCKQDFNKSTKKYQAGKELLKRADSKMAELDREKNLWKRFSILGLVTFIGIFLCVEWKLHILEAKINDVITRW